MNPYYADDAVTLWHGDCLDVLRAMPAASVDSVCTDPPYGLEFMGREWDSFRPSSAKLRTRVDGRTNPAEGKSVTTTPEAYVAGYPFQDWCQQWAAECLRVLKPGGHLLAFGGTRTVHRLTCGIEDAGFEIRDPIDWLYGSGFPKSVDVSKMIDRAAGAEREVVGQSATVTPRSATTGGRFGVGLYRWGNRSDYTWDELPEHARDYYAGKALSRGQITAPATDEARRWSGFGTALKPAREPIVVARKPLAGTVAANVLAHGTGALNIDACRTPAGQDSNRNGDAYGEWTGVREDSAHPAGRWPTNVVLSHAPGCGDVCLPGCPVADLDRQSGTSVSRIARPRTGPQGDGWRMTATGTEYDDRGGASRFFPTFRYEAKADAAERPRTGDGVAHPTVKPLALMRWLVRLVTPPGGVVLDPFAGSGTTAEACVLEGFRCITVEREADYLPLIVSRLSKPLQPALDIFGEAS